MKCLQILSDEDESFTIFALMALKTESKMALKGIQFDLLIPVETPVIYSTYQKSNT